ncbi:1-phosphofructokinase [Ignatzschineria ureiclastica]|uniref:Phosphofructokinase n=1 Tax=Ignatzschineria ureiclastica TaxID=472582 RepID=A0A2U2AHD5_9GAMM|nr:1-phosphofructokinase family hexose kinase [Ignatzschineria ureiclastica]PWD81999.1 1-phosphofructokinase [Ignatzschineria ureiclastica]GGZ91937.1 phosphofructokinase [Ignatzschineria ureiclastica]
MSTILAITLNPAIDQTIKVPLLTVGAVQRAESVHYNAGGKGIMVASCLADWGQFSIRAGGLLGESNSQIFEEALKAKSIQDCFVRVSGQNRTNIKIVDQNDTTDINLPGIAGNEVALQRVAETFAEQKPALLVLSGSLAEGMPVDSYRQLIKVAPQGSKVILDASGEALIEALKGDRLPFAVKPNEVELSQWAGRKLETTEAILTEARKLVDLGVALVVISMGGEGAYFLSKTGTLRAYLKAPKVLTTVGAGDAMVAGMTAAIAEASLTDSTDELDLERVARLGTAFAVGTLGFIGPHLPENSVVETLAQAVQIDKVEK